MQSSRFYFFHSSLYSGANNRLELEAILKVNFQPFSLSLRLLWFNVKKNKKCFFFEKYLRIKFDIFFYSESHDCIFDSLVSSGGKLWLFECQNRLTSFSLRIFSFCFCHNLPPDGARTSKISLFESESKTT